jgi:DNA-binding transcriptional LysR family regulator
MKLDVLGIQAFVAVADGRTFREAAQSLHITQTALTRRLQTLEAFLGVKLIERTTRSSSLSSTGRDFLPQARRLIGELAASLVEIRESGKAKRGDVTIACVPTMGVHYLPGIIQAYAAVHPDNRIRILDHASSTVVDAVLRREAEFGIAIASPQQRELTSVPLVKDRFVLICRRDHALARRRTLRWQELAGHRLIYAGFDSSNRAVLDLALAGKAVDVRVFYEVQRSATAVGLVADGVGAAVVPRLAIQPGAYPDIKTIDMVDPVVSRPMVLVTHRGAHLSPAAQALYDMVRRARPQARDR